MKRKTEEMDQIRDLAFKMLSEGITASEVARQIDVHRSTLVRWMQSGRYADYLAGLDAVIELEPEILPDEVPLQMPTAKNETQRARLEAGRKAEFLKALRATGRTDVAALYVAATPDDVYQWTVKDSTGLKAKAETFLKIASLCWEIAHDRNAKPTERLKAAEMLMKNSDWSGDVPHVQIDIKTEAGRDKRTPVQVMLDGMKGELERFEGVDLLNVIDITAQQ